MRALLLPLLTLIIPALSYSQDVFFDWAKQLDRRTGISAEEAYFIGVDASKNVYLAGNYRNYIDLDPGPGAFEFTCTWDHVFIIKLDPLGNFIWGKDIGGDRFTLCRAFTVDPEGNVYLTGSFSGITDFDPGPAAFTLSATKTLGRENYDFFVVKLDTEGNFQWANQIGSLNDDWGNHIEVDAAGNVYTTGEFAGPTDFDPGPGVYNLGVNGMGGACLNKFDKNGNFIWAKAFIMNFMRGRGPCIKLDKAGNVYATGIFEGNVDFDPGPGTYIMSSPLYSYTPYFIKLNASGDFLWAKQQIGGSKFEVDPQGNIICHNDILTKYDTNGNKIWSAVLGGIPDSRLVGAHTIRVDAAGNIFVAGIFNYTKDFDPGPGVYNITAVGNGYNHDAFLCRLDPDGNLVYAKSYGGYAEEHPSSMVIDTSGNIYTTGIYGLIADFDPGSGTYNMTAFSGGGFFIQKLSPCSNRTFSTLNIAGCTSYQLNNIRYDQSGTYHQSLRNSAGCDSVITLNLTLLKKETTLTDTACETYSWNSRILTSSGYYSDTLTTATGCDSIVHLNLFVRTKSATTVNKQICEGQSFEGYTVAGSYVNSFIAANGCDSVRTLHLTVNPKKFTTVDYAICQGQTYLGHSASGTYIENFISRDGCDSIRTLNLTVHPVYSTTNKQTICRGQNILSHTETGIYIDTLRSQLGCDSIVTTHLTVVEKPLSRLGKDTSLCIGDSMTLFAGDASSYLWQDGSRKDHLVIKKGGVYSVTLFNSCGTVFDQVEVKDVACNIDFPTAFTPNNDGKNDRFHILNGYDLKNFHLVVYNRWGQIVFESRDPSANWNGSFRGTLQDSGVYIWYCTYTKDNATYSRKGTVTLIR